MKFSYIGAHVIVLKDSVAVSDIINTKSLTHVLKCGIIKIKIINILGLRRFQFPFVTTRLRIRVIPTIVVVINSNTVDYIRGFDDLGGKDEFRTETLEWRLSWYFKQLFALFRFLYFCIKILQVFSVFIFLLLLK